MVKKGNIIQILDHELGVFSETLELEKIGQKVFLDYLFTKKKVLAWLKS